MGTENERCALWIFSLLTRPAASDQSEYPFASISTHFKALLWRTHNAFNSAGPQRAVSKDEDVGLCTKLSARTANVTSDTESHLSPSSRMSHKSHMMSPPLAKAALERVCDDLFPLHLMPLLLIHIVELGIILHRQAEHAHVQIFPSCNCTVNCTGPRS